MTRFHAAARERGGVKTAALLILDISHEMVAFEIARQRIKNSYR